MSQVTRGAKSAGRSETARKVVLFGWAAKGVVYVALAYLVLQMAFGQSSQDASTTGALRLIAQSAPGKIVMIVLGVGLLAFAVGRILEVTTLATPQIETKDKVTAVVLAVLYTSLALTAFSIVGLAGSSSGGGNSEQQGSAFLLGLPGGRWIVGLVGLAVIAFGIKQARRACSRSSSARCGPRDVVGHALGVREARHRRVRHQGRDPRARRAGSSCSRRSPTTPTRPRAWTPRCRRSPGRRGARWC
jgi:hypothetical protein